MLSNSAASLSEITDDNRINISPKEYKRIRTAKRYYQDDFAMIKYKNSYGETQRRRPNTLNITKMAAQSLASIIFNDKCSIAIKDDEAAAVIGEILEREDFYNSLEEHLEKWIALGGGAVRPYVSNDKIKLAWVNADQFYPLRANTNHVEEAAIASRTYKSENGQTVYYTLLEFHQWKNGGYLITYELYRSTTSSVVGQQVPLNSLDEYKDLPNSLTLQGLTRPLFAYFKAPGANNYDNGSPLGVGLVDNAKNTIDAINTTHDQFVWEVKLGNRRIIVPYEFLKPVPKGKNNLFDNGNAEATHPPLLDTSDNVFTGMYGSDPERLNIKDVTSTIRADQYQAAMTFFLHEFENETGLSQGTFSVTPTGVQTATEVVSQNAQTYRTRSSYLSKLDRTIKALIVGILELAKCGDLFSDGQPRYTGDPENITVDIDYKDGLYVNPEQQYDQDLKAVMAQALPLSEFLKRNYNITDEQAAQWIDEIRGTQAAAQFPEE